MVFKGKREGSFQLGTHISSVLYTSSCLTFCTLPASSTLMKKISNFKIRLQAFCQMNYGDPLAFSSWLNKKKKKNQSTEELLRISFLTVLLESTKYDQIRQEKHPQVTLFPHRKEERGEDVLLAGDGEHFVLATSSEAYNCRPFQAQTAFRISPARPSGQVKGTTKPHTNWASSSLQESRCQALGAIQKTSFCCCPMSLPASSPKSCAAPSAQPRHSAQGAGESEPAAECGSSGTGTEAG